MLKKIPKMGSVIGKALQDLDGEEGMTQVVGRMVTHKPNNKI